MHRASNRFWKCFDKPPPHIQKTTKKNFQLLKINPRHSSLHFKMIGKFWSIRVGIDLRALAVKDGDDFIWVWIGTHNEYEQILKDKN